MSFRNIIIITLILNILPLAVSADNMQEKDLIGYWNFNEGNGAMAHDSVNKNDGIISQAEWTKGKRGYGLEFNGEALVDCGNNPLLDIQEDLTISLWIKLAAPSENKYNHIIKKGRPEKGAGYYIRTCGNSIQMLIGNGKDSYNSLFSKFEWDNKFHLVTAVISRDQATIYIDGEKIVQKKFNNIKISDSRSALNIGPNFKGIIDEVKIFKSALSSEFIKQYSATFADNSRPEFPLTALAVKTPDKITIDAELNEWTLSCPVFLDNPTIQATRYNLWENPDIFSAVTALMYDNKTLYISGYVKDKNIHSDHISQCDMIELQIYKHGNAPVSLFFQPIPINGSIYHGSIPDTGIEAKSKIIEKGYIVEAGIPFTALGISPDNMNDIKIQLGVHDTEQGGERSMIMRSLYWNGKKNNGEILFLSKFDPISDSAYIRMPSCNYDKKFYTTEDKYAKLKVTIPPPFNNNKVWQICLFNKKGQLCFSRNFKLPTASLAPSELIIDIPLNGLQDNVYFSELSAENIPLSDFKIETGFTISNKKSIFLKNAICEIEQKLTLQEKNGKKEKSLSLLDTMKKYHISGDYDKAEELYKRLSLLLKSNSPLVNFPDAGTIKQNWENKIICGKDFYYFIPWDWKYFELAGIKNEPFIVNGAFFNKSSSLPDTPSTIFGKPGSPSLRELEKLTNPVMMKIHPGHPSLTPFCSKYLQSYEFCEKQFGKRFLGTFIVMGEMFGGHPALWSEKIHENLENFYKQKIDMPRNREEAYEYVRKIYSCKINKELKKIIDLPTAPNLHFFNKLGVDICIPEIGGWEYCTQMQLACARGAARQYDKAWGTYIASYQKGVTPGGDSEKLYDHIFPWTRKCSASNLYDFGPVSGTSLSLMKRMLYASYMSGANFVFKEGITQPPCGDFIANYDFRKEYGAAEWLPTLLQDRQWHISELGDIYREMYNNIVANPQKNRGETYAPVALLFDKNHGGMTNRFPDKIYNNPEIPFKTADYMERSIYNTVFPYEEVPQGQTYEAKTMVTGPFGDVFDMLDNDASSDILKNYPVVFLAGDVSIDENIANKLKTYVKNGGILIANICQLNQYLPESFFGCRKVGSDGTAIESLSLTDCIVIKEKNPFTYEKVKLTGKASSLIETINEASPILIANTYGKGTTLLTTPPYLMDMKTKSKMLNIFSYIIKNISLKSIPFVISCENIEYIVNKSKNGYVITLINNDGVYKYAGKKEIINLNNAKKVKILFKQPGKYQVFEWMDNTILDTTKTADGIETDIVVPPGDIRIVEFKEI